MRGREREGEREGGRESGGEGGTRKGRERGYCNRWLEFVEYSAITVHNISLKSLLC